MDKPTRPLYELIITDESDGVHDTALVHDPANGFGWVAFSSEKTAPITLAADKMKRNVSGVLLVPGQKIFRSNPDRDIQFTRETIEQTVRKYSKDLRFGNVNVEHQTPVKGAHVIESWLTGKQDKAASLGFKGLPEGTWMITMHIEDDALWDSVLDGTYRGFSIEGFFDHKAIAASQQVQENKTEREDSAGVGYLPLTDPNSETMTPKEFLTELTAFLKGGAEAKADATTETKLSETPAPTAPVDTAMESRIAEMETGLKQIHDLIKESLGAKTAEVTAMSATIDGLKAEVETAKTELSATKADVTKLSTEPVGPIAGQEKKEAKKEIEHEGLKRLLA